MGSDVLYGVQKGQPGMTAKGNSSVYSQIYPFEGLLNYTSGIIHHVRLTGTLLHGRKASHLVDCVGVSRGGYRVVGIAFQRISWFSSGPCF